MVKSNVHVLLYYIGMFGIASARVKTRSGKVHHASYRVTDDFNIGVAWYNIRYIATICTILCHICRKESKDKQGVNKRAWAQISVSCFCRLAVYARFLRSIVYNIICSPLGRRFFFLTNHRDFKNSSKSVHILYSIIILYIIIRCSF